MCALDPNTAASLGRGVGTLDPSFLILGRLVLGEVGLTHSQVYRAFTHAQPMGVFTM